MQKMLASIVLLFAVCLGETAYALPQCQTFCACSLPCTSRCAIGTFSTNCGSIGVCQGGGQCHQNAPGPTLTLAVPASQRAECTAGDDPFAAATDDCPPTEPTVATAVAMSQPKR